MKAVAYEWHNYGKLTIGNRADIERVPVDNLRSFYKRFYQPDNAVLVVAGKFDEKKALSYIEKYFGSIPRPDRKLQDTYTEEPPQDGERFVTLRRVGSVGLVGVLYHVPAGPHAEFPAVEILAEVLGSEPSGRLYKALVETRKASSVSASAQPFHDPGTLDITAEVNTRDRSELEKVRDVIFSVVDQVERSGVTQEEVDRARQSILKDRELSLHDPNEIAVELSEWAAQGDWRLFFLHRDRIEKVTPAEVKDAAAKYLVASNRTVGFFLPSAKPERTPIPETPDVAKLLKGYAGRKSESASGETFDVSPAAIEARVLRPEAIGGVKLALLPKKSRGSAVQMRLTLRFGDAENLKGFVEAGRTLPELMTRGTKSMTRQQIEDALDKNFARLGGGMGGRMMRLAAGAGAGSVTFALETKRANLPAVLEILRQILREPTLPQDEFEVLKREDLTAHRAGPHPADEPGLQPLPAPSPPIRATTSATCRRSMSGSSGRASSTIEQIRTLYREYLGADPRRARDDRRLRALGSPADPRQDPRWLEGGQALRADRAADPAGAEARDRHDRDARQAQCRLRRRPRGPDQGQRSRLSRHGHRRLHPRRRRPLVADRQSPPPEGRGLLQRHVDVRRRSPRLPRRSHDPRDLQPDQRPEGQDRRHRGSRSPPQGRRHGRRSSRPRRSVISGRSRTSGPTTRGSARSWPRTSTSAGRWNSRPISSGRSASSRPRP